MERPALSAMGIGFALWQSSKMKAATRSHRRSRVNPATYRTCVEWKDWPFADAQLHVEVEKSITRIWYQSEDESKTLDVGDFPTQFVAGLTAASVVDIFLLPVPTLALPQRLLRARACAGSGRLRDAQAAADHHGPQVGHRLIDLPKVGGQVSPASLLSDFIIQFNRP